jgi:hypothetical protein
MIDWIKSFEIVHGITGDGLSQSIFSFLTILFIGLGWWLTSRLQKKLINNNLRVEVYKEISKHFEKISNTAQTLSVHLMHYEMIFIVMETSDAAKQPYEDGSAIYQWSKFVSEINQAWTEFNDAYQECSIAVSKWEFLLPNLKKMHDELFFDYFFVLFKKNMEHVQYLRELSMKELDWKLWDRGEIDRRSNEYRDELTKIIFQYFDDYTVEAHNTLIGGVFNYKKKFRQDFKNLGDEYNVYTKNGIKTFHKSKKVYFKKMLKKLRNKFF